MRLLRALGVVALLGVAAYIGYRAFARPAPNVGASIAVYYTKIDGTTLAKWNVSLGPARDLPSVAFYAAVQAVAGPAVRVPVRPLSCGNGRSLGSR